MNMKYSTKFRTGLIFSIAFVSLLTLSNCKKKVDKKCCEGYTGKIDNAQAEKLLKKCHFLSQDSIELWTKRYDEQKQRKGYNDTLISGMDQLSSIFLKNSSVSFNSCIIKKILCDENSIGLRVLYGIGGDNRIHIILVGIKPDYSNLYVDAEAECCTGSMNKTLGAGLSGLTSEKGGAEFGQMP
jgi:hypothetical protein